MTPRHPDNERAKRRYLQFLKDVKGRDEASLDAVAKAIDDFDTYNKCRDFRKFHIEQARGFKSRVKSRCCADNVTVGIGQGPFFASGACVPEQKTSDHSASQPR